MSFEFVGLVEKLTEAVETAFDQAAAVGDPIAEGIQPAYVGLAHAHASDLGASDQPACLEHLDVLDDSSQRDVEGPSDLAHAGRPAGQTVEDCPPCGFGKRPKAVVDTRIVKHRLYYSRIALIVKP